MVIVDDGSTDASLGVIRQYESRVEIVTGPNCGAPAARNRGLEQASAPFVMFLDADDYMEPSSLDCWLRDAIEADLVLGPFARELNGVRTLLSQVLGKKFCHPIYWHGEEPVRLIAD